MNSANEISAGLGPIRSRFLALLQQRQIEILDDFEKAVNTPEHALEALARIEATLHKIAGTAGTLGLNDLGNMARQVEEQIIAHREDPALNPDELYDAIVQFLELSIGISSQAA